MTHLTRQKVPKSWSLPKKGTAYVVNPKSNINLGIPILVALRDILKFTQNRKETKKAINQRFIKLNGKDVREEKNSLVLFDVLTIEPTKKNYRLTLTPRGRFTLEEIDEKHAHEKVSKVIGKKILKGKKTQLNLMDGRNILTDLECKLNDSIVVELKTNKAKKCLSLQKGAKIIVFGGKHTGKRAEVMNINEKEKIVEAKTKEETINVLIKQALVEN